MTLIFTQGQRVWRRLLRHDLCASAGVKSFSMQRICIFSIVRAFISFLTAFQQWLHLKFQSVKYKHQMQISIKACARTNCCFPPTGGLFRSFFIQWSWYASGNVRKLLLLPLSLSLICCYYLGLCVFIENTLHGGGAWAEAAADGSGCSDAQQQLSIHCAVLWSIVQGGKRVRLWLWCCVWVFTAFIWMVMGKQNRCWDKIRSMSLSVCLICFVSV